MRARLCGGLLIRRAVGSVQVARWEQRGDEGLSYELAVAFGWPAAADDEQVVEFGRAVGPQDVGGFADGDAGPQVAGVGQAAAARLRPALARQARAALAMGTTDMTFDPAPARRAFPDLPNTDIPSALKELLA